MTAVRGARLEFGTWHPFGRTRDLVDEDPGRYPRRRASAVRGCLPETDVALIRVGTPDRHGLWSLGPSGSITVDLIVKASAVVAEIDSSLLTVYGPTASAHFDAFDLTVDTATRPQRPTDRPPTDAARNVARTTDRASVQRGIATLTEAVGRELAATGCNDLRLVGMESQAALDLLAAVMLYAVEIIGRSSVLRFRPAFGIGALLLAQRCTLRAV